MISLPNSVLDLLDAGRITITGLMKFEFGTGTYGFAKSIQPFVYGGLEYKPGGAITVSDLQSGLSGVANPFEIKLSASPEDGLTPEILRTIENEDYRDRPVTIYDAYFHPDTNELLHVATLRRGYVDVIDHDDSDNEGYTITAMCETRALDYTRTNGRKRTNKDQARRQVGDKFFEHAATRGRIEIFWGRVKTGSTSNPYGGVGGIS